MSYADKGIGRPKAAGLGDDGDLIHYPPFDDAPRDAADDFSTEGDGGGTQGREDHGGGVASGDEEGGWFGAVEQGADFVWWGAVAVDLDEGLGSGEGGDLRLRGGVGGADAEVDGAGGWRLLYVWFLGEAFREGQGEATGPAPEDSFAGEAADDLGEVFVGGGVEDLAAGEGEAVGVEFGGDVDGFGELEEAVLHGAAHFGVGGGDDGLVVTEGFHGQGDFEARMAPEDGVDFFEEDGGVEGLREFGDSLSEGVFVGVTAVGGEGGDGGVGRVAVQADAGFETACGEMDGGVTGSGQVVGDDGDGHGLCGTEFESRPDGGGFKLTAGEMKLPNGNLAVVRSAWILGPGEVAPRLTPCLCTYVP